MASATKTFTYTIPLDKIRPGQNARPLDEEHRDNLAASMTLAGLLVPVTLTGNDDSGYEIVAGHHRFAAAQELGWDTIEAAVLSGDAASSSAAAAIDNIVRKQLTPYEEATAIRQAIDGGLTVDGAASMLGMPTSRVQQRMKLWKLPEALQQEVGRTLTWAAVDWLLAVGEKWPEFLPTIENIERPILARAMQRLDDPAFVISSLLRDMKKPPFVELVRGVHSRTALYEHTLDGLKLGKKTDALREQMQKDAKKVLESWQSPEVRFQDAQIDMLRAADVLLEFDGSGAALCIDKALYREAVKMAVADAAQMYAEAAAERKPAPKSGKGKTPEQEEKAKHRAAVKELQAPARAANHDLGVAVMTGWSRGMTFAQAKLLVMDRLGEPTRYNEKGGVAAGHQRGEAWVLAAQGVRRCVPEMVYYDTDKGNKPIYASVQEAEAWLWKFIDGAQTADDLIARYFTLVAMANESSDLIESTNVMRGNYARYDKDLAAVIKEAGLVPKSLGQVAGKAKREATRHAKAMAAVVGPIPAEPEGDDGEEY